MQRLKKATARGSAHARNPPRFYRNNIIDIYINITNYPQMLLKCTRNIICCRLPQYAPHTMYEAHTE